ncbi:MurR/RpiR family transcriptional regulator [Enterococcus massiliensis]|uniref:MurR/RpiR family transcriptional regulator n=1 Tax=Enterococcus massiliensis TaxID=1640685 RepID=UPI00065E2073|nr:MurR/RpiR family transcriptional regulator [Enterococcus massiliensis]
MFDSEKVQFLNDLEIVVYNYINANLSKIKDLTIRELADSCHVSTSTILRTLNKLGYDGYAEFKYVQKKQIIAQANQSFDSFYDANVQVDTFLKKVNNDSYRRVLEPAIQLIVDARHVAFSGIGTSGLLGAYGSRYFSNVGINAYSIADPFAPVPPRGLENTLAIILSVSGETTEMIEQTTDFKRYGAKVLSITNNEKSTIAKLSDHNISYYMPDVGSPNEKYLNLTTQVPVVALIEILAQQVFRRYLGENK